MARSSEEQWLKIEIKESDRKRLESFVKRKKGKIMEVVERPNLRLFVYITQCGGPLVEYLIPTWMYLRESYETKPWEIMTPTERQDHYNLEGRIFTDYDVVSKYKQIIFVMTLLLRPNTKMPPRYECLLVGMRDNKVLSCKKKEFVSTDILKHKERDLAFLVSTGAPTEIIKKEIEKKAGVLQKQLDGWNRVLDKLNQGASPLWADYEIGDNNART